MRRPRLRVILMSCLEKRAFPFKAGLIGTITSDNWGPGPIRLNGASLPCLYSTTPLFAFNKQQHLNKGLVCSWPSGKDLET